MWIDNNGKSRKMDAEIYAGLDERQRLLVRLGRKEDDPNLIIDTVCEVLNVSMIDLVSPCRKKDLVEARSIAVSLILQVNNKIKLTHLGRIFNRDHSTIIYQRQLYNDLYNRDRSFTKKANKVLELV